jgi:hypothetical protein
MYILQTKGFMSTGWFAMSQSENLEELLEKERQLVLNGSSPESVQVVKIITVEKGE